MDYHALIVDNSAVWRETFQDLLADAGIVCVEAASAADAFARLPAPDSLVEVTGAAPFQLALVDAFLDQVSFDSLPEASPALDLIRQMQRDFPRMRIIALAERILRVEERQKLRDLNVAALFEKPTLTLAEMQREVNAVMHSTPYRLFITYRREDGQYFAAILHHLLNERLGPASVFMDIYDIPGGEPWDENIQRIIPTCQGVILIIGHQWRSLDAAHQNEIVGGWRGQDYVREELEIALRHNVKIIPVLIENAPLPEHAGGEDDWFMPVRQLEAISFPDLRHDRTIVDRILKDLGMDARV